MSANIFIVGTQHRCYRFCPTVCIVPAKSAPFNGRDEDETRAALEAIPQIRKLPTIEIPYDVYILPQDYFITLELLKRRDCYRLSNPTMPSLFEQEMVYIYSPWPEYTHLRSSEESFYQLAIPLRGIEDSVFYSDIWSFKSWQIPYPLYSALGSMYCCADSRTESCIKQFGWWLVNNTLNAQGVIGEKAKTVFKLSQEEGRSPQAIAQTMPEQGDDRSKRVRIIQQIIANTNRTIRNHLHEERYGDYSI